MLYMYTLSKTFQIALLS